MLSKLTKSFRVSKGGKESASTTQKRDHFKAAFKNGNILQLFSRTTGSTLQVNGNNSLDGLGSKSIEATNTLWTVTVVDEKTIQLNQDESYLSIVDGEAKLVSKDEATEVSKLRLSFQEQFVLLEDVKGCGHHIGILGSGEMKAAIATGAENNSHFALRIVFTAKPETNEKIIETAETGDEVEADKDKSKDEEKKIEENSVTTDLKDNEVKVETDLNSTLANDIIKEVEKTDIEASKEVNNVENDVKDEVKDVKEEGETIASSENEIKVESTNVEHTE